MRKIGKMSRHIKILISLFLLLLSQALAELKINASIDVKQVLVQDSFTWKLEVEDSEEMPQIRLPDIPKVALLSGPMQSSNYTYVNGKMTSKKTLSYTFVALEAGKVTIPSIEVFLGGSSIYTKPIKFEIIGARQKSGRDTKSNQPVFIRAIPSKKNIYVGEPVSVKYKLFTKVGVFNYQVDKLPDAVGFWAEEIPQNSQPRLVSEIVEGVRYNTAVLKTVLYYPTRSGNLLIDPLRTELEIEAKTKQRSRRTFNDPFFNDPFFSGSRKATKNFMSNPITIRVKRLPEPRPANFSGAVGSFRIKADLDTNAVFANDAVGLNITLSGVGNFKSLNLPEPKLPDGVDVFKPERSESVSIKNMRHQGLKRLTYLLVPRTPGRLVIDPIKVTYFDLKSKRYITKSSGKISLMVYDAEGNQPLVTSGYSREEVELMQDDIRYIKASDDGITRVQAASFPWNYWFIHIIGILAVLGLLGYEYRMNQYEGDRGLHRRSKAMRDARKKLKQAQELSEDSPVLRSLLHQCIVGFIGARLNAAENALDSVELLSLLRNKNISGEIVAETRHFLDGLSMDRFAPGAVQRSASEWVEHTEKLLQSLGKEL